MAFDGLMLSAITAELLQNLQGGKIDRVYQPAPEMLLLHIRNQGINHRLLLSAHAAQARAHLTQGSPPNPPSPPMFCMVLRKHLEGGRIIALEQPGLERQLNMHIENVDEIGVLARKILTCEFMGKHSNIILYHPETGVILDGIKRYTHAVSRYREVLPGRPYLPPPAQDKINPAAVDEETFRVRLLACPLTQPAYRSLMDTFQGFSRLTAREVAIRAGLSEETTLDECGDYELSRLWQALEEIVRSVHNGKYTPTLVRDPDRFLDFAAVDLTQYDGFVREHYASASALLDAFFTAQQARERLQQARQQLETLLNRELKRCLKKKSAQQQELAAAANADGYRLAGELLTAHLYHLEKGASVVKLDNFYDPDGPKITVELQPELTPNENAQVYFKKYNKAKNAVHQAQAQLVKTNEEESYMESVLYAIGEADSLEELAEIRRELQHSGYLSPDKQRKSRPQELRKPLARPLEYSSADGFSILVGRNNVENDLLSLKLARENDLWLHVKEIPGSHVLVRADLQAVPTTTLHQAAALAAYYSKARQSANVAVDYTKAKYVRKPSGARPGMVIYDHHHTIYVNPCVDLSRPENEA